MLQNNFQDMKKLHAKLLFKKGDPSEDGAPEMDDQPGNDVDLDEEEVKQEMEARMACAGDDKSRVAKHIVYLDIKNLNDHCFRISDFPEGMEPGNKYCLQKADDKYLICLR